MVSSSHYRTPSSTPSALSNSHRPSPLSRRTASSYNVVRPYEGPVHHHRAASSSALPLLRTHALTRPTTPITGPPPPHLAADHRFSRLFPSLLGSPYLTTSEIPQAAVDFLESNVTGDRSSSPAPTADFSVIDAEGPDSNPFIPGGYPMSTPKLISSLGFSRGRQSPGGNIFRGSTSQHAHNRGQPSSSPQSSNSFKSLLPRVWEVLSSPSRTLFNLFPQMNVNSSPSTSRSSSRAASPSASPRQRPVQTWYTNNGTSTGRHSSIYWPSGSLGKSKGKSKATGFFSHRGNNNSRKELDESINYLELPPLDGEEGELIDDEACFIDIRAITGIGEHFLPLAQLLSNRT